MPPIVNFRVVTFVEVIDGNEYPGWRLQFQRDGSDEWNEVQVVQSTAPLPIPAGNRREAKAP